MSLFEYIRHPHVAARKEAGPVAVRDQAPTGHSNPFVRFNARFALACTAVVGSMWCAYAFAALAVSGLPAALKPGNIGLLFWISSDLLQLTLLSVIIVGQNLQAKASDKRAEQTFLDAEAVLHEATQIQAHLAAQDDVLNTRTEGGLTDILDAIRVLEEALKAHVSGAMDAHQEKLVSSLVNVIPPPPQRGKQK